MNPQRDQWKTCLAATVMAITLDCGSADARTAATAACMPCCKPELTSDSDWTNAFAARVRSYDGLFQYIVMSNGPPVRCRTYDIMQFDGERFGSLRFEWQGGLIFEVKSMPPESSEIALRKSDGFPDQEKLIDYLREYVKKRGIPLSFDRSVAHLLPSGAVTVFESNEPGVNASVRLENDMQGKLVGIVLLLAL